jgi:hypothetical protein
MQPYARLTQRNTQLFMQFAASPEMVSLWLKNGQQVFNQISQNGSAGKATEDPAKAVAQAHHHLSEIGKSEAFAGFLQGMMQSHMQLFAELAQTNMATLSQGPAKMLEQMQQAASNAMALPQAEEKKPRSSKHKDQ